MEKIRKKRRVREPFIVVFEWCGKRQEDTHWNFSLEDVSKSIDKQTKKYEYFFNDKKSPYIGNPNYNPNNYKLISILPYPKKWVVTMNNGDRVYDTVTSVNAQTDEEARDIIKKQYPRYKILNIKEGIQII